MNRNPAGRQPSPPSKFTHPNFMHDKNTFPLFLLLIWLIEVAITGFFAQNRVLWQMEAIPLGFAALVLLLFHSRLKLSNTSYTLIFAFFLLPVIPPLYSWIGFPYLDKIWPILANRDFHADRILHFSSGILLTYPIWEILKGRLRLSRGWLLLIVPSIFLAFNAVYEVFEWLSVHFLSRDDFLSFIGIGTDPFDTQKDLLLNFAGAMLSCIFHFFRARK